MNNMGRRLLLLHRGIISRAMTTTARASSGGVRSPWLMMEPGRTRYGTAFRFWSCAKRREHRYEFELWNWKGSLGRPAVLRFLQPETLPAAKLVGSSQGWLAYRFKRRLYLVDPTTYRCTRLPDFNIKVSRLLLSPLLNHHGDPDALEHKAFMICGDGSLAFCSRSRRQGGQWNIFSSDDAQYESVVYSSIHRRLLCLTRTMKLEAWDVQGQESPSLDWAVHLHHHHHHFPSHTQDQELGCVRYLVCAEQTGDLFLVLRFFQKTTIEKEEEEDDDDDDEEEDDDVDVDEEEQDDDIIEDKKKEMVYNYEFKAEDEDSGWYPVDPSVYFEVYKIEREGGSMMKMEESLDGMSIFVGMNDSLALKIPPEEKEMKVRVPSKRELEMQPNYIDGIINIFYTREQRIQIKREYRMKIKMKKKMKMMKIIPGDEDEDEDKDEFEDDDDDDDEEVYDEEAIREDCVHFTYDDRIGRNKYIGKFDYKRREREREVEPLWLPCFQDGFLPAEDDVDIAYPLWFTPGAGSPQGTLKETYVPYTSDFLPAWESHIKDSEYVWMRP